MGYIKSKAAYLRAVPFQTARDTELTGTAREKCEGKSAFALIRSVSSSKKTKLKKMNEDISSDINISTTYI